MSSIAVVVPTIRQECYEEFLQAWGTLFSKHKVVLITVIDGENPVVRYKDFGGKNETRTYTLSDIMGENKQFIFNFNDGVRNLGFAFIAIALPCIETIIALDDDTLPCGDTIQHHIDTLDKRVPVSWLAVADEYTRGFPYGIREEAEVVLSHGVWDGIPDFDAPTQLVKGNKKLKFYKGPIPKGIYYPMCGMNLGFKRKMLPYMYYAPMGEKVGVHRFSDIWCGISSKDIIDSKGWAVYSGGAKVIHKKASNVYKNLKAEAVGIGMNEKRDDTYFNHYKIIREGWAEFILSNGLNVKE